MDWFLYDMDLHPERVEKRNVTIVSTNYIVVLFCLTE